MEGRAHEKGLARIEAYDCKWNEWTHATNKHTRREMAFVVTPVDRCAVIETFTHMNSKRMQGLKASHGPIVE